MELLLDKLSKAKTQPGLPERDVEVGEPLPKLRVGIVNFLNSKPLAWGFLKGHHADLFAPSYHPPALVARLLGQGEPRRRSDPVDRGAAHPGPARSCPTSASPRRHEVGACSWSPGVRSSRSAGGARPEQPHLGGAAAHPAARALGHPSRVPARAAGPGADAGRGRRGAADRRPGAQGGPREATRSSTWRPSGTR